MKIFLEILVAVSLLLYSIFLYGDEREGNKEKVEIPSTTKVLDEKTLQHLSISENGSMLVFDMITPVLKLLSIGDVIVGGVSKTTPYGLSPRRVIAIKRESNQIVIKTTPVTLEDAIKKGNIEMQRTLKPHDTGKTK
jgi:hypothetical protein